MIESSVFWEENSVNGCTSKLSARSILRLLCKYMKFKSKWEGISASF